MEFSYTGAKTPEWRGWVRARSAIRFRSGLGFASPHSGLAPAQCAIVPRRVRRPVARDGRLVTLASSAPAVSTGSEWDGTPEEVNIASNEAGESDAKAASSGLQRFWQGYNRLLDSRPILVKSLTSLFGFMIGDVLAQFIAGQRYCSLRTLRMVAFGVLMDGPIGHVWYTSLDKLVYPDKPTSKRAVVSKMLCDQLLWAPAFTCVFFSFMCCLEGRPHMIAASIRQKLLKVLLTNYAVWPLAHLINFRFIPSSQRILYINACQILWSTYLSTCQARS